MAEKKTIKLEDVAELAGVSKTTVSRVLNNRGYLSDKTIKKVHDAMDELNYRPNVIARQLFKQKTNLVAHKQIVFYTEKAQRKTRRTNRQKRVYDILTLLFFADNIIPDDSCTIFLP